MDIWTISPATGGRVEYGGQLAKSFRDLGHSAEEVLLNRYSELKKHEPDKNGEKLLQAAMDEVVSELVNNPPELIVDFAPVPAEFYELAHDHNVETAFWLLEDGLNDSYEYWKEYAPVCKQFFVYQGPPFEPEKAQYLPWGSPFINESPGTLRNEIVFHGSALGKRKQFIESFLESFVTPVEMYVAGPGWDEWEFPENYK
ncbi:MAG: hypothetical protein ABEJ65_11030, partial [bacterium]